MRRRLLVPVLLVITALLAALAPATGGAASGKGGGTVTLDPNLPVHPILQYGAATEPDKKVRVIVQKLSKEYKNEEIAADTDATLGEEFAFIDSVVMDVKQKHIPKLAKKKGVKYITPDAAVHRTAIDASNLQTNYAAAIGVPSIWNSATRPATGKGITVAVLDSGVNTKHPDFAAGGVTALIGNGKTTRVGDDNGHGTHVVGIIKSRDAQGRYIGVAPDANIISLKIADDEGRSTEADLIRGLQWVYSNRSKYNIRVVNLSVSGSAPTSFLNSPISAAAEQLWFNGVVVVTSSGNRGPGERMAWYPPANDPWLISVGALDHNDTVTGADDSIAPFSTRGYTQNNYYRPDVVAPGRKIVSALAGPYSTVAQTFPDRIVGTNYVRLSGTSMAAPVVAGVTALILEKFPNLTPDQVKWLLVTTARSYPGQPDGAGVVDPGRALDLAALGNVLSANQGLPRSQYINATTGTTQWAQSYWEQSYWEQSYWEQSYWEQSSEYDEATFDMTGLD